MIAVVCAILTYQLSFFSGIKISENNIKNFEALNASTNIIIMLLTGITALISFIAVFLFANRKLQLRLTIVAILASVGNLVVYFLETAEFAEGNILLTAIFAFVIPFFLVLAARGIWKDQKLVKSMDRLR